MAQPKENKLEKPIDYRPGADNSYLVKINIFYSIIVFSFAILLLKLFTIQVIHGKKFESMAINK